MAKSIPDSPHCGNCRVAYSGPDIIDSVAYFVCEECGEVEEIPEYKTYTVDESISLFKEKFGFQLPANYENLLRKESTQVVRLPPCNSEKAKQYFEGGFYVINSPSDLNPNGTNSIFRSESLINEWGLPSDLVLIEGDGHTWLALDYSGGLSSPCVIVIESDESTHLIVSESFEEFLDMLVPYEEVFDEDGSLVDRV